MSDKDKLICKWKIKVLTPVHIGGAQEKHWQEGLDFVIRRDKVYFLDQDKMINHWGVDNYSNALAQGSMNKLTDKINLQDFSSRIEKITGKTREIKQHIKNQASGKPIIPGSSLKGAIRSVIFTYLLNQNNSIRRNGNKYIEKDLFGSTEKDFMRFLQVGDVEFEKTEILNTKIFNLSKDKNGGFRSVWKNRFRDNKVRRQFKNEKEFNSSGMTAGYECIPMDQEATLRIKLDLDGFNRALKARLIQCPIGLTDIFNEEFSDKILSRIRSHTRSFFKKEMGFFKTYAKDGSADYSDYLFEDMEDLQKKIVESEGAPLRIAAGSGFHSITGDWQHQSHLIDSIWKGRGSKNRQASAKTRKLGFTAGTEGGYFFDPLGFIVLEK